MVWPGTAVGGVTAGEGTSRRPWGDSIRLWIRAGLAAGRAWHIGVHADDRLDSGNVMGPATAVAETPTIGGRLWVDLSCDVMSADIVDGSTRAVGVFSRDEAATLDLELYDPERKYDPTNTASPYWFRGRTRLVAGTPVEVFAEVLDAGGATVTQFVLFRGTADRWTHDVERDPLFRRTRVVASGAVKGMSHTDYPEVAAVGAGDTTAQRIARLVAYYGYAGGVVAVGAPSAVTLASTTLAQSFWELLNRTLDDELGYVHVLPDGRIRWLSRNVWQTVGAPVLTLGCEPGELDIATDVMLGTADAQLRNAVYAARAGGVQQVVKSLPSIAAHGGFESALHRTDLGLASDVQVAEWANTVVMLYAYPSPAPEGVRMMPAREGEPDGATWRKVLGVNFGSDVVRVNWTPEDGTAPLDTTVRVVGVRHEITPDHWAVEWQTIAAQVTAGNVWHIGVHAFDRLDSGNVMGFAHA